MSHRFVMLLLVGCAGTADMRDPPRPTVAPRMTITFVEQSDLGRCDEARVLPTARRVQISRALQLQGPFAGLPWMLERSADLTSPYYVVDESSYVFLMHEYAEDMYCVFFDKQGHGRIEALGTFTNDDFGPNDDPFAPRAP